MFNPTMYTKWFVTGVVWVKIPGWIPVPYFGLNYPAFARPSVVISSTLPAKKKAWKRREMGSKSH